MKTYTAEQLKEILELHRKWLRDEEGGKRADLSGAYLSGADLRDAYLRGADLRDAKEDVLNIISITPNEVPGLLESLKTGKVDGSVYEGECACLVGTIANVRQCNYREIEGIEPDSDRPAERLFLSIKRGDTPEMNPVSKLVVEWIEEWQEQQKEVATN